jgi:hypothetical protein
MLALALSILCKSLEQGFVNYHKHSIIAILMSVIEGSDSSLLLSLVSQICDSWILHQGSPLTSAEQWVLFCKINSHFDRISDFGALPHSIRFAAISERIGRLYTERPEYFAKVFGQASSITTCNALGILGLMSPWKPLWLQSHDRFYKYLGNTLYERILNFFSCNLSPLSNRIIPIVLPCLFYHKANLSFNLNANDGSVIRSNSNDSPNDTNENSPTFKLPSDDSYSKLIKFSKRLEQEPRGLLRCLSELTFINAYYAESVWSSLLPQLWQEILPQQRDELTYAVQNYILRAKFKKMTYWPSEVPGKPISSNVPQYILKPFMNLNPPANFSVSFLSAITVGYACDNYVMASLERIANSTEEAESKQAIQVIIYSFLERDERDLALATYRMNLTCQKTNAGLALEMYDRNEEAAAHYISLIKSRSIEDLSIFDATNEGNVRYKEFLKRFM